MTWDRMAEDGVIADCYPLMMLPKGGYRQRTRLNVVDSDGTAILYNDSLTGGTRLTRNLCALLNRPYILINAREIPDPSVAATAVLKFIERAKIETLNVAGPRASGWPAGYGFALDVVSVIIGSRLGRDLPQGERHVRERPDRMAGPANEEACRESIAQGARCRD